jgi:ABC-type sugar transport system substrate-binding protein
VSISPDFHCERQDLLKYSRKLAYWQCPDIFFDGIAFFTWINDPSALGALSAIVKAGREKDITIVGFDASPAGKQAVYEKKIYDTPQQFPRKMAKGTVDAFIAYLKGESVEKTIFIPCAHYFYEDSVNDQSRISDQW